jgi:large repetitive protein
MDWTRRSAGNASAWQIPRLVLMILAVPGAVILVLAGAGCGHGTGLSHPVAPVVPPHNRGSGCPTQGVGGDTLAPPCASPVRASTGRATGTANSGIALPAPTSSLGITPIVTPTPTPTTGIEASAASSPQVTGISPASGAAAGGDSVAITGSGFTGATAVYFGGVSAVITAISGTQITATSPSGSGTVDVTVVTPTGTSAISPADQFSYH